MAASKSNVRAALQALQSRGDLDQSEIAEIKAWARSRGVTWTDLEARAVAKGVTRREFAREFWAKRQACRLKADQHEKAFPAELTITQRRVHSFRKIEGGFECWIDGPGTSNPYRFINPPLLVPDPDGDVVFPETIDRAGPVGAVVMREDAEEALKQIISQAIERINRKIANK